MSDNPFLSTQGIHNFRDYGGWPAADGRSVRTGLLYRSGQHVDASDDDLAAIDALGIRTVIDLRGSGERERHPCRRPSAWAGDVVFFDGETTNSPPHMDLEDGRITRRVAHDRMIAIYRRMPHNPAMHTIFTDYLRVLAERDGASLVHCFAGKDRTGVAVTLLLHILGVSENNQLKEFLRTNEAATYDVLKSQSLPNMERRFGSVAEDAVDALMKVHEDYLAAFHDEVRREYGSLDAFLERKLAVDDTRRARLIDRLIA